MTHVDANVDAFEEAVVAFCADFEELGIKTTLKMHIVDEHLTTFVKSVSSGFSLAAFSEQAMESCHYFHEKYVERCNVPKSFQRHARLAVLLSVTVWNSDCLSFAEYARLKSSRA